MLRNKQLRTFIRLVLLILLLDAMVNALPAAFAMAEPSDYLNESRTLWAYFGRFLRSLLFHSVIYILFLWWVHPLVAVLYLAVVSHLKRTLLYFIGAGIAVSLTVYLLYAYNFSVDRFMDYFLYRVLWYGTLGALFGGSTIRRTYGLALPPEDHIVQFNTGYCDFTFFFARFMAAVVDADSESK